MTSNHMGQGPDNWGDGMHVIQGPGSDELIRAGYGRTAAPAPAPAAVPPKCDGDHGGPPCADPECWAKPDELEQIIDGYLEDYELIGEDEAGRDGCYRPTETERRLIKDAFMGLLAHDEWDAAWGRLIDQRAAEKAHPAAPVQQSEESLRSLLQSVEDALDKAGATIRRDDGHWLTMPERIAALSHPAPGAGRQEANTDVRHILLDVVPGIDGMGREVYATCNADVEAKLSELALRIDDSRAAPAVEAVTDQVQDAVTALIEAAREAVATINAYDESDLLALDDDPHPPSSLSVVSTSLQRAVLALARKGGAK